MTVISRTADLSRARPPRWAWDDRIVIGGLNLLLGNEGVGKGTFAAWLIARLTCGELPGDLRDGPVRVGIVGDEDHFDDVWSPRLHAAGADLGCVVQLEDEAGDAIDVRGDREELGLRVREEELAVVYFDQLLDNISLGTDSNTQKPIRDALRPLRALARDLEVATLCTLHPNKRAASFRELVSGSAAFNALSRSSLLLAEHPDDEERRVLVRGKGNLSRAPAGVEFAIESHRFTVNGYDFNVPLVTHVHVGDLTIDDVIEPAPTSGPSKIGDATEIIEALLPRDGGWHPAKPIFEACAAEEIIERTVKRAKQRLAIEHRRGEGFPAPMLWRWSDSVS